MNVKFHRTTLIIVIECFFVMALTSCMQPSFSQLEIVKNSTQYKPEWRLQTSEFGELVDTTFDTYVFYNDKTITAIDKNATIIWARDVDVSIHYNEPLMKIVENKLVSISKDYKSLFVFDLYTGDVILHLDENHLNTINKMSTFEIHDGILIVGGKNEANQGVVFAYSITNNKRLWIQYHGSRREPREILNCNEIVFESKNSLCLVFGDSIEIYSYDFEEIDFESKNEMSNVLFVASEKSHAHLFLLRNSGIQKIHLEDKNLSTLDLLCQTRRDVRNLADISSSYLVYRSDCNSIELIYHNEPQGKNLFELDGTYSVLDISVSYDEQYVFLLFTSGQILQVDLYGNIVGSIQLNQTEIQPDVNVQFVSYESSFVLYIEDILLKFELDKPSS